MSSLDNVSGSGSGGGGGAFTVGGGNDSTGDANSALAELDQGLRCGRLGEQSESIVRFPRLFQKYPFPILINSALLKLADIFRQNSNFIRLCVLRVCQESERHLDKITSVDEFVRRVSTVLHSNDPVARALTLRTLGAVAVIIPERKSVHHSIRNSLDSHDAVELHAAMYAAGQFAAQSKTFAVNMCSKIADMIKGYATPLEMKLKLIPIFQHMHHDAQTAAVVRETCVTMLPAYPSQDFVLITLHTLTILATHTLVDVPDQVELLLKYLNQDARKGVMKQVLADLRFLASAGHAHLWKESNVSAVIHFATLRCGSAAAAGSSAGRNEAVLCGALAVLGDIVEHTGSTRKFSLENSNADVIRLCEACCYRSHVAVAARATRLLTFLASYCRKELRHVEGMDISSEAVMAIEALLITTGVTPANVGVLRECLRCMVLLCRVQPDACDQFVDVVGGMLTESGTGQATLLLCESLAALGGLKKGVLKLLLPDICHLVASIVGDTSAASASERARVLLLLSTLLLQTLVGHAWPPEAQRALEDILGALDMWSAYRVARNASRYGHYDVAARILKRVTAGVSSEHLYFWLTGLAQVCAGEARLNETRSSSAAGAPDLIDRLSEANTKLFEALVSIKAATTPARNQEFQIEYLRCRSEMLGALLQLLYSCNSLRTSPPPAIANAQAKQSHDDLQRCGRITQLLRKAVKDFEHVGQLYGKLYETSFDADPETLIQIQTLQHLNLSISQWIERVCLKSSLQGSIFDDLGIDFAPSCMPRGSDEYGIELQALLSGGQQVADCFRRLASSDVQPITNAHTESLQTVVAVLCSTPLAMPRHFYQALQQTSLKLAVTPQPRSPAEPIAVSTSQHLAIKVEGVITTSLVAAKPLRRVASVSLTLTSHLSSPPTTTATAAAAAAAAAKSVDQQKQHADCAQTLEQVSVPHNDFFTAQFLLPFPVGGSHSVTIETSLVDVDERSWRTGLKSSLTVKAFEDGQNRPTGAAAQTRR